jgi:hypothetical protein
MRRTGRRPHNFSRFLETLRNGSQLCGHYADPWITISHASSGWTLTLTVTVALALSQSHPALLGTIGVPAYEGSSKAVILNSPRDVAKGRRLCEQCALSRRTRREPASIHEIADIGREDAADAELQLADATLQRIAAMAGPEIGELMKWQTLSTSAGLTPGGIKRFFPQYPVSVRSHLAGRFWRRSADPNPSGV